MRIIGSIQFAFALAIAGAAIPGFAFSEESAATAKLRAQSAQFPEEVIRLADGVYTAVGYSVSNSSMIVGEDGVIIVDTGMEPARGALILEQFRKITDKPVKAIVLTHSHPDHIGGITAFLGEATPQIWARANFGSEAKPLKQAGVTYQRVRGARQGGFKLPPDQRINNGIAPAHYPKRGAAVFGAKKKSTPPTHTFDGERKRLTIAGVSLELVAAPGETHDQLFVWLPEQKVLFAGDNLYRSFPNLYAIRGTPNRSVDAWATSIGAMLEKEADALVPGHTKPFKGADNVKQFLTDYRDAIRFTHDKTVEGMNKGLTPDALVDYARLPDALANKDYLQPFYGNPDWGIRSVFNYYLGWFDGNPTNLFPLTGADEARRMAEMAGGRANLMAASKAALASNDPQWAAQLADYLIALDPSADEPKQIKAEALTRLADQTLTATARNYYLTVAQELRENLGKASSD